MIFPFDHIFNRGDVIVSNGIELTVIDVKDSGRVISTGQPLYEIKAQDVLGQHYDVTNFDPLSPKL